MIGLTRYKPRFTAGYQRYLVNGNDTIEGYLKCDGSVVLQSSYPKLFNDIKWIPDNFEANIWVSRTSNTSLEILDITYDNDNGIYVYVGQNGTLGTSTDSINWTTRTSGTTSNIYSTTYGNGLYVYGGGNGTLGTSTDSINWTTRTSGSIQNITTLVYGNGLYVMNAYSDGYMRSSTNGINWVQGQQAGGTFQIIYENSIFLCAISSNDMRTSTNGITWTAYAAVTTSTINALTYGNGLFLYGGDGGALGTSTNAVNWTARTSGTTYDINGLSYYNGTYVLYGDKNPSGTVYDIIRKSTNAINWTTVTTFTNDYYFRIISNNNGFIMCGSSGKLKASSFYTYNQETEFKLPETIDIFKYPSQNNYTTYIKAE